MAHYNTIPTRQQWQKDVTAGEVREILAKVCTWLALFVEDPSTDRSQTLKIDVDNISEEACREAAKQLTDKGFETSSYEDEESNHTVLAVTCWWE